MQSMLDHPDLGPFLVAKHFTRAGGRAGERELTLDAILDELETFGEVALVSAPINDCPQDRLPRRCVCTVTMAWNALSLHADGHSRLLAALRCLMEVLTEVGRQEKQGHREIESFLLDQ
jgi:hypothetical protein